MIARVLPIIEHGNHEYFVDFRLKELRMKDIAKRLPFYFIHDEELKAKIRRERSISGPNEFIEGIDN